MEKSIGCDQSTLIAELSQGKELAKQLMKHLHPSTPHETQQLLVERILSCYEKALSKLNWDACVGESKPISNSLESPASFGNCSPRGEGSDQDSKHGVFKKRKTFPRWTEQVKICSGTGVEGQQDDGYSWRKYGQKDILGARFPRGYYRCTHRNAQGCLATKQVQRSDEDPSIFEVTYRGRHTCCQTSRSNVASASTKSQRLAENRTDYHPPQNHEEKAPQDMVCNFGGRLIVKTEDLDTAECDIFPSFSFSSTPIGTEDVDANIFCESMLENNFISSLSPTFLSPATSESNLFSMSPCHMNSYGLGHNVHTSESDLTETISAPTSATNSPIGHMDFPLDKIDLDPNFPFDHTDFFA